MEASVIQLRERAMVNIRIDDEVFARLQELAEPFVDDPNSVLRRVLGLSEAPRPVSRSTRRRVTASGNAPQRAHSSELLAGSEYYLPILQTLSESGGSARSRDVIATVGEKLKARLKPKDFEETSSGVIRWENRCRWAAFGLRNGGFLKSRKDGIWELSESGREAASKGEVPKFDGRRG